MVKDYMHEAGEILAAISCDAIERVADALARVRDAHGIVWTLGLGGSAATASHMTNDLRKLCDLDSRCLSDNAPEMLARINDDGWPVWAIGALAFAQKRDAIFVVSVGGGGASVSAPIMGMTAVARGRHMAIAGVVGRDGGHLASYADACVIIPPLYPDRVTPHTEGLASVVCHAIVTKLQRNRTKW